MWCVVCGVWCVLRGVCAVWCVLRGVCCVVCAVSYFILIQVAPSDFFKMPARAPAGRNGDGKDDADDVWVWMSLYPAFQNGAADHADIYYVGKLDTASVASSTPLPSSPLPVFRPSTATPFAPALNPAARFGHKIAKSGGGDGRRLIWGAICGLPAGAIPNPRSSIPGASATHQGCTLSLGQEITVAPNYSFDGADDTAPLQFRFIPELQALRLTAVPGTYTRRGVPAGLVLPGRRLMEIKSSFVTGDTAGQIQGLDLFGGLVRLQFNATSGEFSLSGKATLSLSSELNGYVSTGLRLADGEALSLHVYVDGSVVEAIANDRAPIAANCLPAANASLDIAGVGAELDSVEVWQLKPSVTF